MHRLAGLQDVVRGLQRLLDRGQGVQAVDLVEVDVVGAEAAQAVIDLGKDRLARQAGTVRTRAHRVPDLCGDEDVVAVGEVIQRPAQDLFAGTLRVHVRGVEEVDARLDRLLDERTALLLGQRPRG